MHLVSFASLLTKDLVSKQLCREQKPRVLTNHFYSYLELTPEVSENKIKTDGSARKLANTVPGVGFFCSFSPPTFSFFFASGMR